MLKCFAEKMWVAATHIFSAKNIRILCTESAKTVNEMTLNELVKLTTLWTTGPCMSKAVLTAPLEHSTSIPAEPSLLQNEVQILTAKTHKHFIGSDGDNVLQPDIADLFHHCPVISLRTLEVNTALNTDSNFLF